jgi:exopolysaccharide biosynthesis protein
LCLAFDTEQISRGITDFFDFSIRSDKAPKENLNDKFNVFKPIKGLEGIMEKRIILDEQSDNLFEGNLLYILKMDISKIDFFIDYSKRVFKNSDFKEPFSEHGNIYGAFNAGFFGTDNLPLGFLKIKGRVIQNLRKSGGLLSNGLLVFDKNGPAVLYDIKGKDFQKTTKKFDFAIQSGPVLVKHGKPLENLNRLNFKVSSRTAAAFDSKGNFLVVLLYPLMPGSGVSIYDFARILCRPGHRHGAGAVTAINLDGGSSSQIILKRSGFFQRIGGLRNIPLFIFFRPVSK